MQLKFNKYKNNPSNRKNRLPCSCCRNIDYKVNMYILKIGHGGWVRVGGVRDTFSIPYKINDTPIIVTFCIDCFNKLNKEYEKINTLKLVAKNELENIIVQQQMDINKLKYDKIHLENEKVYLGKTIKILRNKLNWYKNYGNNSKYY